MRLTAAQLRLISEGDEERRALERAASQGDIDAMKRVRQHHSRNDPEYLKQVNAFRISGLPIDQYQRPEFTDPGLPQGELPKQVSAQNVYDWIWPALKEAGATVDHRDIRMFPSDVSREAFLLDKFDKIPPKKIRLPTFRYNQDGWRSRDDYGYNQQHPEDLTASWTDIPHPRNLKNLSQDLVWLEPVQAWMLNIYHFPNIEALQQHASAMRPKDQRRIGLKRTKEGNFNTQADNPPNYPMNKSGFPIKGPETVRRWAAAELGITPDKIMVSNRQGPGHPRNAQFLIVLR